MRTFGLSDAAFGALAAGRPARATLDELRKAQVSRHLLQLRATGTVPSWYGGPDTAARLADPMFALHTAATLAARHTGAEPPGEPLRSARRLTAEHGGLTLRVRLEDTDPLRARLGLSPTGPLDDDAAAAWQRCLDGAWRLLVDRHQPAAATLAAVLSVIVPVESDPGAAGISATSAEAYGAVALSPTTDPVALAVGLLHEAQHSVLNAVLVLFDLVQQGPERGYSPWRDDPRPPLGVLHGAYAYLAVTRFWRAEHRAGHENATELGGSLAAFEFARWRAAVVAAADELLAGQQLTGPGRRFAGALRDEAAAWLDEPVDPEVSRLAAGANLEHRVRWRLRNLPVSPASVAALVEAWRAGSPPPPALSSVAPAGGRALAHSDRLSLVHRVLRERDQSLSAGSGVRPQADAQRGVRQGTHPRPYKKNAGDDAYLEGQQEAAFEAFMRDLTDDDPAVWSGLALVSPYTALRDRPEVVRAAWLALDRPDLPALAAWLSRPAG
ncbi:MAG: HEXXH motif-containing putative peptide modification protein [Actinoplanes sp.]